MTNPSVAAPAASTGAERYETRERSFFSGSVCLSGFHRAGKKRRHDEPALRRQQVRGGYPQQRQEKLLPRAAEHPKGRTVPRTLPLPELLFTRGEERRGGGGGVCARVCVWKVGGGVGGCC
ncbi:unnamed protein product [Pleuronectes platessa]|uniref:Uncharacterized protein n=1 Tax=Pleuronectes platessa TaxID=8262 RepID=A0A9N7YD56_PLEPL|nr:unnamed protein product [Pleuronectes platessa]